MRVLGLLRNPPSKVEIGARSIVTGTLRSDREGSCVRIGNDTFVGNSLIVSADSVTIGDGVLISWGCQVVDHDSHSLRASDRLQDVRHWHSGKKNWEPVKVRAVRIGDRAWLGFGVSVLKGVTIGEGAVVAACAVVTKDVEPYTLVAGNPARMVRELQRE